MHSLGVFLAGLVIGALGGAVTMWLVIHKNPDVEHPKL